MNKKEVNKQLGEFMRFKRKEKKFSLRKTGYYLGISNSGLLNKERGNSTFYPWDLGILIKLLEINPLEILEILKKANHEHFKL